MIYDAVICVAPHHKDISLQAIKSLQEFSAPRSIYIITAKSHFVFFTSNISIANQDSIKLIDEDHVIENVNLLAIKDYMILRSSNDQQAGWYFQQFLKMSMCYFPELSEYYLIWDSDTIALQPLIFFNQLSRVLISYKTEHHTPYFKSIEKLLGIKKNVKFSFVAEHFMITTKYMQELIAIINARSNTNNSWVWSVLDSITDEDLSGAGFSEYETYGNFLANNYPDSFQLRYLKSTRFGSARFGMTPNLYDLSSLRRSGYYLASFEIWDAGLPPLVAINKFIAKSIFKLC